MANLIQSDWKRRSADSHQALHSALKQSPDFCKDESPGPNHPVSGQDLPHATRSACSADEEAAPATQRAIGQLMPMSAVRAWSMVLAD